MKPPLSPLPRLDQVLVDPTCVVGLMPASLTQLLLQIAAAQSTVTASLVLAAAAENSNPASAPDEMLSVAEVAKLLRKSSRYIWRNQKKLPFLRRVGKRGLLASKRELDKWIANQRIR